MRRLGLAAVPLMAVMAGGCPLDEDSTTPEACLEQHTRGPLAPPINLEFFVTPTDEDPLATEEGVAKGVDITFRNDIDEPVLPEDIDGWIIPIGYNGHEVNPDRPSDDWEAEDVYKARVRDSDPYGGYFRDVDYVIQVDLPFGWENGKPFPITVRTTYRCDTTIPSTSNGDTEIDATPPGFH
jgi:hypothetical protein